MTPHVLFVYTLWDNDVLPGSSGTRSVTGLFENFLPKDPGKRDLVILALIVVPLMVGGVIWGILGNFDDQSSEATPVATPPLVQESTPEGSPEGTPAAFVIVEAA
jgi:hypothetical protein